MYDRNTSSDKEMPRISVLFISAKAKVEIGSAEVLLAIQRHGEERQSAFKDAGGDCSKVITQLVSKSGIRYHMASDPDQTVAYLQTDDEEESLVSMGPATRIALTKVF